MLSESLQTDRGVDNKVSNIDFVISDYLCTKNDNNMELSIPTTVYQITNYLEEIGEKRFAKAMAGA